MPGGIHPPREVVRSWPTPDYVNPVTRPMAETIIACVFGPVTLFLMFARLWIRLRIQRNCGWDDWFMIAAIWPVILLTVIIPLAADKYHFNRHIWDVEPRLAVVQRKLVLAIECLFCVATGLIKISVLLFYRRLSARTVSKTFRWISRITITFVAGYSIAFTLVPIFGCQPISAFWDQTDVVKLRNGYKYKCFNEGADVVAATIISTAQDLLTAVLPTFMFWHVQIPIRQKIALFGIFAIAYVVVGIGAVRIYTAWEIFFKTYDVTWVVWEMWNWTLLEIHLGAMCANAPALKVFFSQCLNIRIFTSGSHFRATDSKTDNYKSRSTGSGSLSANLAFWKSSHAKAGYLSEPHTETSVDRLGGVQVQREIDVYISPAYNSEDTIRREDGVDIELRNVKAQQKFSDSQEKQVGKGWRASPHMLSHISIQHDATISSLTTAGSDLRKPSTVPQQKLR
ncbi:hypothetical protein CC80DRAFT_424510 [Byssothecium circinans]|uniref:Rhodopsin domain-containing protein n=1 Tax=Byssothecium circinans TaxID=147558 RepID=A0A6A5TGR7_9PLEO|nr:hypothetical protein CC80DRAFT_424510 [Byssothecium circinans]